MRITEAYLDDMPEIYRDIFTAFYNLGHSLELGWEASYLVGYGKLDAKYNHTTFFLALIEACDNLVKAKMLTKDCRTHVYSLTENGKLLTEAVVGKKRQPIPKFIPPTKANN